VTDGVDLDTGTSFTIGSYTTTAIAANGTATVNVSFTPNATFYAKDSLSLSDSKGRSFVVSLTGSGFQQPNNLSAGTPALWLRADRISSSDIAVADGKNRVNTWQDQSGNGNNASAVYYSGSSSYLRPVYNDGTGTTNMNHLPSITFSGVTYSDQLKVIKDTGFIKNATGTTTLIAFKTGNTLDTTRYLLQSFTPNNTAEVFPRLLFEIRYIDIVDGYWGYTTTGNKPATIYPFATGGSGVWNSRHVIDTPANFYASTYTTKVNTPYAIALKFDNSITSSTTANFFMYVNDTTPKTLGYLYSYTSTPPATYPNNGAYGLPAGDGAGNVNPTLNSTTYPNDYGLYLASQSVNHAAFYNRVDSNSTNIATLYIGATNGSSGNFKGEIAEIVIFPRVLSDTELGTMLSYLRYKYNLY
jgi:hypothetical protein